MAINDIEGARPKKDRFFETRNIMDVGDIHGTKAKKVYVRETAHDSFNYHDITKNKFVSSRSVNPLTPSYTVKNESG